jgi:putative addiction module component (TIGR02574 family)
MFAHTEKNMDIPTILGEVSGWSADDRQELANALLDSLENWSTNNLNLGQRKELRRRVAELDANPADVLSWDQIKAHVKRAAL